MPVSSRPCSALEQGLVAHPLQSACHDGLDRTALCVGLGVALLLGLVVEARTAAIQIVNQVLALGLVEVLLHTRLDGARVWIARARRVERVGRHRGLSRRAGEHAAGDGQAARRGCRRLLSFDRAPARS